MLSSLVILYNINNFINKFTDNVAIAFRCSQEETLRENSKH